jgi:hypothetical protein
MKKPKDKIYQFIKAISTEQLSEQHETSYIFLKQTMKSLTDCLSEGKKVFFFKLDAMPPMPVKWPFYLFFVLHLKNRIVILLAYNAYDRNILMMSNQEKITLRHNKNFSLNFQPTNLATARLFLL